METTSALSLIINGQEMELSIDPRTTLVDLLRGQQNLTGTKKGCDRGECGACTVLVNGRRVLSCMTLALTLEGSDVLTVEGLAPEGELHAIQRAFLEKDAFQCGFCTPGQVMSALGCVREGHTGSAEEIKEWMSGNICRCAAYPQIVEAVSAAAAELAEGAR